MAFCPRCGTGNPPAQTVCSACGSPLQPAAPGAPSGAAPGPDPKKTMLGMGIGPAPGAPPSSVSPTWPDAPALQPSPGHPASSVAPTLPGEGGPQHPAAAPGGQKKTMLGMGAVPAPGTPGAPAGSAPAQPPAGQAPLQHTMLGIAPIRPPGAAGQGAPAQPAPPAPGAQQQHQTMLGMAPPQPGAQQQHQTMLGMAPPQPSPPAAAAPPSAPAPGSSALPSQQKTMLGIAHPGIAPLDPTASKPAAAPAPCPPVAAYPAAQPARSAGPSPEDLSVLPGHKPRRVPIVAILAIGGFAVLLVGVVAIAVLWKSSGPLAAKVTLDPQNHEQLELSCTECPDGTQAALGKATSTFKSGHAVLAVEQPLSMGDNTLQIALTKPGENRASTVDLTVPVEYRVRGELGALSDTPPKLRVTVQAVKGTKVSVDGKPLPLAADGIAHYDLDVTRELSGSAASIKSLARKLPYSVQPPGSKKPDGGEIKFQVGIVPLVIDAPGPGIVTDRQTFMLAGHTEKGATLKVGDRPIKVDAEGSFAQLMNVSATGETTIDIRASAKDRAPRLFPLHVKRVKNLRDEAAAFQKNATRSYAGIASSIDSKKGWPVTLGGKVVESRVDHHRSYVLLDVSDGCRRSPCLARLVYGASTTVKKGDRITAYGHVTGGVDGPRSNNTIPEIRVDFLLEGPPP